MVIWSCHFITVMKVAISNRMRFDLKILTSWTDRQPPAVFDCSGVTSTKEMLGTSSVVSGGALPTSRGWGPKCGNALVQLGDRLMDQFVRGRPLLHESQLPFLPPEGAMLLRDSSFEGLSAALQISLSRGEVQQWKRSTAQTHPLRKKRTFIGIRRAPAGYSSAINRDYGAGTSVSGLRLGGWASASSAATGGYYRWCLLRAGNVGGAWDLPWTGSWWGVVCILIGWDGRFNGREIGNYTSVWRMGISTHTSGNFRASVRATSYHAIVRSVVSIKQAITHTYSARLIVWHIRFGM